jgi:hypothetical protein
MTIVDEAFPGRSIDGIPCGHEPADVALRGLIIFATALVGTGIVTLVVLSVVMRQFTREETRLRDAFEPLRPSMAADEFPSPRLQQRPAAELDRMKAMERRRIDAYGWVDRSAGIASIPVERAMDILAQRGLPRIAAQEEVSGAPPDSSTPPPTSGKRPAPATDRPAPAKTQQPRHPSTGEPKS